MQQAIRSVAVFCGARNGHDPLHAEAARALGAGLAEAGIQLVYGGGSIGLMGAVSSAALAAGGVVRGIIPEFLMRKEKPDAGVLQLEVTTGMHDRKARMFELADAFVTLSGGLGTLDETVEILTWKQLNQHNKPIIILDIGGWAKPLVALFEAVVEQGFAPVTDQALYQVVPDVPAALDLLRSMPALAEPATPVERL